MVDLLVSPSSFSWQTSTVSFILFFLLPTPHLPLARSPVFYSKMYKQQFGLGLGLGQPVKCLHSHPLAFRNNSEETPFAMPKGLRTAAANFNFSLTTNQTCSVLYPICTVHDGAQTCATVESFPFRHRGIDVGKGYYIGLHSWIFVVFGGGSNILVGWLQDQFLAPRFGVLGRILPLLVATPIAIGFFVGMVSTDEPWTYLCEIGNQFFGEFWEQGLVSFIILHSPPNHTTLSLSFYYFLESIVAQMSPLLVPLTTPHAPGPPMVTSAIVAMPPNTWTGDGGGGGGGGGPKTVFVSIGNSSQLAFALSVLYGVFYGVGFLFLVAATVCVWRSPKYWTRSTLLRPSLRR